MVKYLKMGKKQALFKEKAIYPEVIGKKGGGTPNPFTVSQMPFFRSFISKVCRKNKVSQGISKKWVPEFPETKIYLISKKYGRKKIGSIDHNHTGIIPGVRPAGWLKSPFSNHIVILILCGSKEYDLDKEGCQVKFFLRPFRAHLKHGFVKE